MVQQPKTSKRSWRLWLLVLSPLVAAVVVWIIWYFEEKSFSGTEFSPYTFQTREFTFSPASKPWFSASNVESQTAATARSGGSIYKYANTVSPISNRITQYLPNLSSSPDAMSRWDVVHLKPISLKEPYYGEAHLIIEALQFSDPRASGVNAWESWSSDHPAEAAYVWPIVQQMAIHHLYFAIPEMMNRLHDAESLNEIEIAINAACIDAAQIRCQSAQVSQLEAKLKEVMLEDMKSWLASLTNLNDEQLATIESFQVSQKNSK